MSNESSAVFQALRAWAGSRMPRAWARRLAWLLAGLALLPAGAGTPVHRCVINGTVSFQSQPCASGQTRPQPNIERLNAERKRRLDATAADPARAAPAASTPMPQAIPATRCDGRRHCSQMRSCAEARYFLANCPNVEMDGDRDGIPCEQQWCSR